MTPRAKFFDDLGGESIDALELQFRLEKRLRVKVEIQKLIADGLETDEDGVVHAASLNALHERFDYLRIDALPTAPKVDDLKQLITVDAIIRLTQSAVEAARGPVAAAALT